MMATEPCVKKWLVIYKGHNPAKAENIIRVVEATHKPGGNTYDVWYVENHKAYIGDVLWYLHESSHGADLSYVMEDDFDTPADFINLVNQFIRNDRARLEFLFKEHCMVCDKIAHNMKRANP